MDVLAFYAFAAIAVIASLLVIGQGNPMHSVMLLIVSFGALAGLYVLLDAPFTAVTQIIVYAGAIMVLFLFVIFLINPTREEERERLGNQRTLGLGLGLGLLALVAAIVLRAGGAGLGQLPPPAETGSNVAAIGELLYTRFLFPFEVTSLILLAAIIGAIVLAKRTL